MVQLGGKTLNLKKVEGLYNPDTKGDPARAAFAQTEVILYRNADILEELNRRLNENILELSQEWDLMISVVSNSAGGGHYNGRIQVIDETFWDTNTDCWINDPDHPANVLVQNVAENSTSGHLLSAGDMILATKFTSDEGEVHYAGIPEPDTDIIGQPPPTTRNFTVQVYGEDVNFPEETSRGSYHVTDARDEQNAYFQFRLPADYDSLVSLETMYIPDVTTDVNWTLEGHVIADGDTFVAATPTFTGTKSAVPDTDDIVNVLDWTTDVSGFAAGKWVGLYFFHDGEESQRFATCLSIKYNTAV